MLTGGSDLSVPFVIRRMLEGNVHLKVLDHVTPPCPMEPDFPQETGSPASTKGIFRIRACFYFTMAIFMGVQK